MITKTTYSFCSDLVMVSISRISRETNTFKYFPDDPSIPVRPNQNVIKPAIGRLQTFYLFRR